MVHSVVVQPALGVRAALGPSPTDLRRGLLRLDLENQQVWIPISLSRPLNKYYNASAVVLPENASWYTLSDLSRDPSSEGL